MEREVNEERRWPIVVTRHEGARQWLREELLPGVSELESASPDQIEDRVVIGNLPLSLAAQAQEVWAIEFEGEPPRGKEFSVADMRLAGAHLRRFRVEDLGPVEFGFPFPWKE